MTNNQRANEIAQLIAGSYDRAELIDLTYDAIVANQSINKTDFKTQLDFVGIQVDYFAGDNFFAQAGICKRKTP